MCGFIAVTAYGYISSHCLTERVSTSEAFHLFISCVTEVYLLYGMDLGCFVCLWRFEFQRYSLYFLFWASQWLLYRRQFSVRLMNWDLLLAFSIQCIHCRIVCYDFGFFILTCGTLSELIGNFSASLSSIKNVLAQKARVIYLYLRLNHKWNITFNQHRRQSI